MQAAAKGVGIAALVIAIVSIFTPIVTLYVIWVALLIAGIADLMGDRAFTIATIAISAVNLIFLSPVTLAVLIGTSEGHGGDGGLIAITTVFFAVPVGAIILSASGKAALASNRRSGDPTSGS